MNKYRSVGMDPQRRTELMSGAIWSFDLKPRMKKEGPPFTVGSQRMIAGIFLVKVERWKWFICLCDTPSQLWIH